MKKEDFLNKVKDSLNNGATIVFSCSCEVAYSGRAESFLPEGDRLVIIKPDNTLLVHQPAGTVPINYMKGGSSHAICLKDGLFLESQNLSTKEYLKILIKKIHFLNTHKLEDKEKLQLAGSEKDMAEMLYKNPEIIENGFTPLSMEEHTKYGFIDVFGYDKNNTLVIIECKRYVGDLKAVTQLRRYVEKMKKLKGLDRIRGILACPKISPNALKMLHDWGFEFKSVSPPKYLEKYRKDQKKIRLFLSHLLFTNYECLRMAKCLISNISKTVKV